MPFLNILMLSRKKCLGEYSVFIVFRCVNKKELKSTLSCSFIFTIRPIIICNTRFHVKILYSAHKTRVFIMISIKKKYVTFLHINNKQVFVMQRECVYCAVRTKHLNIIHADFIFHIL